MKLSSIRIFNTYIIHEIKPDKIHIFDFGHDYKIQMIFKIPSTSQINNIYYEVEVHTPLYLGVYSNFKILCYEGVNPRTDNNSTLYQKHSFSTFRRINNIKIKNNTEYYIQYIVRLTKESTEIVFYYN